MQHIDGELLLAGFIDSIKIWEVAKERVNLGAGAFSFSRLSLHQVAVVHVVADVVACIRTYAAWMTFGLESCLDLLEVKHALHRVIYAKLVVDAT